MLTHSVSTDTQASREGRTVIVACTSPDIEPNDDPHLRLPYARRATRSCEGAGSV